MKIYEIGTGYTPIPAQIGAATEIVVEELTRSFSAMGEDVEIIDISAEKRADTNLCLTEVKVPKIFTRQDVSLGIMHKLKRVVYSVSLANKLKKILKNSNEKVVFHFHNQYNLFFYIKLVSAKKRQKAYIAYTNHSYIWHGDWKDIEETISKRYFQEVYSMPYADRVFVLNDKAKNNISAHTRVDENKLTLIRNGVNTDVYKPLSLAEKSSILSKNALDGKRIVVQVGSVCERKNQLGALKLLLPFLKQHSDIVYCYAGGIIDENYQMEIEKFAHENGIENQVRYFGELKPGKGLNDLYNMARLMLFPSVAEGFSLTIVEAMSAGIPVAINKSLVFELSDKCISFEKSDEFSEIMNSFILNNDESISEKLSSFIKQTYSWHNVAQEYLTAFNEIEGK
ncbi:MAG: glycosyltransferase family 4 protein [Clostridia bacterium]|nr:glycosyltransferase family 4 protein [Clostridia bacterium]